MNSLGDVDSSSGASALVKSGLPTWTPIEDPDDEGEVEKGDAKSSSSSSSIAE